MGLYVWEVEISAASKLAILIQNLYAASTESNTELLILVSDFMVNSTLKNTQSYLCGMHEMP